MESLQIKCPVCGIILEVTNSKNEAVKRIVCPNCKRTLAITFHDEEKPEQKMEKTALPALYYGQMRVALQDGQNQIPLPDVENVAIRVVRLNDGNCKCLVSTKQDNAVRLNDEYLLLDDEVALSDGDLLYIGKTVLSFNKPFETDSVITGTPPIPGPDPKPIPPTPSKHNWWIAVAACIAAVILMAVLWPKEEKVDDKVVPEQKEEKKAAETQASGTSGNITEIKKKDEGTNQRRPSNDEIEITEIGESELEQLAGNGDVNAQYKLGKLWVNRKDSTNIVKGCNYLKLTSRNGHNEARRVLLNVKSTLREAANNGNTHAENLLKVINGE